MRQRRLRRRADHAGDMAEVVGQRSEQRDVADRRRAPARRIDGGQHAEALAGVQRDVRDVREELRRRDRAHAELAQRVGVLRIQRLLRVAGRVVGELLRRRTASPRARGRTPSRRASPAPGPSARTRARTARLAAAARGLVAVVGDDRAREVRTVVAEVRDRVELAEADRQAEPAAGEVVVVLKLVRVEEVQLRRGRVDAEDQELHLRRGELAGHVVAARERLERRAIGDLAGTDRDVEVADRRAVRDAHGRKASVSCAPPTVGPPRPRGQALA